MNNILPILYVFAAEETHKVSTLLFGELTDDCHGSIMFKIVLIFVNVLMAGITVAATIGIIISGAQILTARDNPSQVAAGKKRIIEVIIGLVTFALMYVALNFIVPGGVSLAAVTDGAETCPVVEELPDPPSGGENPPSGGENPPSGGDDNITYPDGYTALSGGGAMASSGGYKLVNTKQSVTAYQKILVQHKVSQNSQVCTWGGSCKAIEAGDTFNKQYGHCDRFARAFGRDLIQDTTTSDDCITHRYSGGWKTWMNSDKSKILAVIWNQLNNNRPVVLDVQYNSKRGQRHFATAVGYNASVSKFSDFKEEDIYILDTYNGFTTGGKSLSLRQNGGSWRADVALESLMSGAGRKDCHY